MTYISNIKEDKYTLSLELNNNNTIKLSLPNALRRIFISEIPVFAINENSINFETNTSMLQSSYLAKRLQLIPFNYSILDNYDINDLEISLDITNNTDHMISVTTKDFVFKDINDVLVYDNVLFAKLKPEQEIKFTCNFTKSTSKLNGPYFSPVSKSVLIYKKDDKLIQTLTKDIANDDDKKYFIQTQTDKYYLKTQIGEPLVYILDIESTGSLEPKMIISLGLDILKQKLTYLLDSIQNGVDTKIQVNLSEKLFTSYNFLIFDEDNTLGNLINSYLQDMASIDYAGYVIPHPNDNKLVITTSLKTNNTLDANKQVFIETLQKIIALVDKLIGEWKTANSVKSVTKKIKIKKI